MDLAVFKSIKTTWDQRLCIWNRNHNGQKLPKQKLSRILCNIWSTLDQQIIQNGFKKAGIYPYDYNTIDPTQFDSLSLSRWNLRNTIESYTLTDINYPSTFEQFTNNTIAQTTDCRTFEEMLINSMKQIPTENKKRRQVSSGATVITSEEAIIILKEKEKEKSKIKSYKRKKQAEEVPVMEADVSDKNIDNIIEQNLGSITEDLDLNFTLGVEESDLLNQLHRVEENMYKINYL